MDPIGLPVSSGKADPSLSSHEVKYSPKSASQGASKSQAFTGAGLDADLYKPIESYEGYHRYDPDFEWEPAEEKRVVRKVHCPQLVRL